MPSIARDHHTVFSTKGTRTLTFGDFTIKAKITLAYTILHSVYLLKVSSNPQKLRYKQMEIFYQCFQYTSDFIECSSFLQSMLHLLEINV